MKTQQLVPNLSGVTETMLWPLYNRAAAARDPSSPLVDPLAVEIASQIDYDYARSFGEPESGHVLRAVAFDRLLERWIEKHPQGQIVALGEGLETQFHRVDNGRIRWLSVDLPQAIELRACFMPDTERHRNLACSALDKTWMHEVDPNDDVFITAAGLLMYFQPNQVQSLFASIAERFPHAQIAFDAIPRAFSRMTMRGLKKTRQYTLPIMPWGIDVDELTTILRWHPNLAEVKHIAWLGSRASYLVHVVCHT